MPGNLVQVSHGVAIRSDRTADSDWVLGSAFKWSRLINTILHFCDVAQFQWRGTFWFLKFNDFHNFLTQQVDAFWHNRLFCDVLLQYNSIGWRHLTQSDLSLAVWDSERQSDGYQWRLFHYIVNCWINNMLLLHNLWLFCWHPFLLWPDKHINRNKEAYF